VQSDYCPRASYIRCGTTAPSSGRGRAPANLDRKNGTELNWFVLESPSFKNYAMRQVGVRNGHKIVFPPESKKSKHVWNYQSVNALVFSRVQDTSIKMPSKPHGHPMKPKKRIHRFSIPGLPRGAFCKEAGSGSWHWMDLAPSPGGSCSGSFNGSLDVSLSNIIAKDWSNSVIQHYWSWAFNVLKKVQWVCRLLGPLWPPIAHSYLACWIERFEMSAKPTKISARLYSINR
jgi:hypothetical protein